MAVIDAISEFYKHDYSNVHRGLHTLSERATSAFESAREMVRQFIHAKTAEEIIFVQGATAAINLVAQCYGKSQIKAGDEIIITYLEHHSNIVPWQILCDEVGATLRVVPINERGELFT